MIITSHDRRVPMHSPVAIIHSNSMDTPTPTPSITPEPSMSTPQPTTASAASKMSPYIIVGSIVLILGAAGAYSFARYRASQPTPQPAMNQQPVPIVTPSAPSAADLQQPKSMTEAGYNQAFAAVVAPELLAEQFTAADGIFVKYADGEIHLRIPGTIPNLEFTPNQKATIALSSITNASGANILDTKSSFETDAFFTNVDLTKTIDPVFSYKGSRRIHLIEGASSDEINRIEGTISVQLPIGLTTTTIALTEKNQPKKGIGTITITSWETTDSSEASETKINLTYEGIEGQLLAIKGTDSTGQNLSIFSTATQTIDAAGTQAYELTFDGSPTTLTIFETERLFTKRTPFVITLNPQQQTSMQEPTGATLDAATKNALIDTEIKREAIFATNDPTKIRAYIQLTAEATGQTEIMADVIKMSDAEIVQLAKTVNAMFNLGTPDQVRAALLSDKTTWEQISPDSVKYTYHVSADESNSSTLMKGKDGKWY